MRKTETDSETQEPWENTNTRTHRRFSRTQEPQKLTLEDRIWRKCSPRSQHSMKHAVVAVVGVTEHLRGGCLRYLVRPGSLKLISTRSSRQSTAPLTRWWRPSHEALALPPKGCFGSLTSTGAWPNALLQRTESRCISWYENLKLKFVDEVVKKFNGAATLISVFLLGQTFYLLLPYWHTFFYLSSKPDL